MAPRFRIPLTPRNVFRLAILSLLIFIASYLLFSYAVMPNVWRLYARYHPAFEQAARRALTAQGILGDPINIAFVGSEADLQQALLTAGWRPADPVTMKSSLRIATASVLRRAYETAPISSLFVWRKKQDLAFQLPVGNDPRKRHHVRFWRSGEEDALGRPLWLGAATFDKAVGISHLTGQITHHIDANVDAERDKVAGDMAKWPGCVMDWVDDFQDARTGKNGGGDPFYTDGRLVVFTMQKDPGPIFGE